MTESVAYMSENGVLFKEMPPNPMFELTPLYKLQDLTDKEIEDVWIETGVCWDVKLTDMIKITKAILKKAREK